MIGMAPVEECEHDMFVKMDWEEVDLAVPLPARSDFCRWREQGGSRRSALLEQEQLPVLSQRCAAERHMAPHFGKFCERAEEKTLMREDEASGEFIRGKLSEHHPLSERCPNFVSRGSAAPSLTRDENVSGERRVSTVNAIGETLQVLVAGDRCWQLRQSGIT